MGYVPSCEEALELLKKYNKEDFHIEHGKIVGGVMRYFAMKYDPENADFWEIAGLLHDLDFELYPEEHCIKEAEIMSELGYDESLIRAIVSHGYGMTKSQVEPEKQMEKILFATDELTGIIGAAALMRPSKSVQDMNLKSVKKKFKSKSFAAGCSREVISKGAEYLGWALNDLLLETLNAMKEIEK